MRQLSRLRRNIRALDEQIITLLSKRLTLAVEIGRIKRQARLPVCDPVQKRRMLAYNLRLGKQLGLPAATIRQIYKVVHNASVQAQIRARRRRH